MKNCFLCKKEITPDEFWFRIADQHRVHVKCRDLLKTFPTSDQQEFKRLHKAFVDRMMEASRKNRFLSLVADEVHEELRIQRLYEAGLDSIAHRTD